MLTGELRNQIDGIWNDFWSGGLANPLQVIEQITYLIFIKRLDEMQEVEERKATTLGAPLERASFPTATTASPSPTIPNPEGEPYDNLRWSRFKDFEPREMFEIVDEHVFPVLARTQRRRQRLRPAHARCAVSDSQSATARQGRGKTRQARHARPRHQGRRLRIHAGEDRDRRPERPVPHPAPHHRD